MKYRELMMKNFSELAGTICDHDIYSMTLHDYTIGLYTVINRTKAFRAVLLKCENPQKMKDCAERDDFVEYAGTEAAAGEALLKLFMTDRRFEDVEKALRDSSNNYKNAIGHWDDFIRFCEERNRAKGKPEGTEEE